MAYQLVLNKLAGRPLTHISELGIKQSTINKLILENIITWHKGDYFTLTPEAQKWVQSKHRHDKMINPRQEGT